MDLSDVVRPVKTRAASLVFLLPFVRKRLVPVGKSWREREIEAADGVRSAGCPRGVAKVLELDRWTG